MALGSLVLAGDDLHAGQLLAPLRTAIPAADWVVAMTAGALAKPKIQLFLDWLNQEASLTRADLAPWAQDAAPPHAIREP